MSLSLAIEEHRKKEKELYKKAFKKSEESKSEKLECEKDSLSQDSKPIKVKSRRVKSGDKDTSTKKLSKKSKELALPMEAALTLAPVKATGGEEIPPFVTSVVFSESGKTATLTLTAKARAGYIIQTLPICQSTCQTVATPPAAVANPTAESAKASLKAALLTIEEAIKRIGEVEDRAEELRKEGRHAEALILSQKAKTAKLHIDSMHAQQVKAERIQREYFGCGDSPEKDSSDGDGSNGKELRLRGNLFAVDFMNPSPTIIEDARAQGLDLTDRRARRIMYELQKEAGISKNRALEWAKNGTPEDNPEGKDDFVARVIDRVYREESKELAGKLVDGLSRGVLLGMLKARQLTPKVDMGDSSYYTLTVNAKQLAAVVIAGAGAGVLTGLSTYELALAAAKQERRDLLGRIRDGKDGGTLTLSDVSKMGMSGGEGGFKGGSIVDKTIAAVDPDCLHEVVIEEQLPLYLDEKESLLDDMSKDELKELILPFLAGDLFLIWRETDLATEKEKLRMRNKLLRIEDVDEVVSVELREERNRMDVMTPEERGEYEKDKREEVVYTMLQDKYGLDEDKITADAERLRARARESSERLRLFQQEAANYAFLVGIGALIVFLIVHTFFWPSHQSNATRTATKAAAHHPTETIDSEWS